MNLEIGTMLHELSGGLKNNASVFYGKTIKCAEISDDRLKLEFEDGVKIAIRDNGQLCCENRYMSTDDDVKSLIGKKLTGIMAKEYKEDEAEYDMHEQVFVEIAAEDSHIIIVNHNEHNGCYGGFVLTITKE